MKGNSISLGRVCGIPIKASQTLIILLPILVLIQFDDDLLFGLLVMLGVFASVAAHELGHSLAAMRAGAHVHEIELNILGGAAKMSNLPTRPRDEILIALAGPAVSLALGILGLFSRFELTIWLGAINLVILCGFNLLPCFPMDGGRVLRAALTPAKGKVGATRLAVQVGKYFCAFFVVFGLLKGWFMLALIGGYIYLMGKRELMMAMMEHQANHFSGHGAGRVEVSPPPYARGGAVDFITRKIKKFFRS